MYNPMYEIAGGLLRTPLVADYKMYVEQLLHKKRYGKMRRRRR